MGQIPEAKFQRTIQICYLDDINDVPSFLDWFLEWEKCVKIDNHTTQTWICKLLKTLPYPLTIICEPYYVDRVYRDEYYRYYASKHFSISRNCCRLIFLHGQYTCEQFLSNSETVHNEIQSNLIGMVVLKPTGNIGRTLIDPFIANVPRCYVRTTKFEISVLGRIYSINAFPASGQDCEVMTCAEVNVWQIMEYFGTRYRDYKVLLPSEMLDYLKKTSEVNVLPSEGLTTEQEAYLFQCNGLSPRIYYSDEFSQNGDDSIEDVTPSFEDILHFYVESGVPVLINLSNESNPDGDNHSITCIGHEFRELTPNNLSGTENDISIDKSDQNKYNLSIVPTWRQFEQYVFLEDHSLPYQLRSRKELKFGDSDSSIKWKIESVVVPLYKHVFLPAEDAYKTFMELFRCTGNGVVESLEKVECGVQKRIIARIFLTTSRAFKEFRVQNTGNQTEKLYYIQADYPKFLWVCEYGTLESYCQHKVKGEFILDATASIYGALEPVVAVRQGKHGSYRGPNDDVETAFNFEEGVVLSDEYSMFEHNNLKIRGGRQNNV